MSAQMALSLDAPKSAVRYRILDVLQDGKEHSGLEFVRGTHGFHCLSYSQRIGQLRREGYSITARHNGGVASYTLDSKEV